MALLMIPVHSPLLLLQHQQLRDCETSDSSDGLLRSLFYGPYVLLFVIALLFRVLYVSFNLFRHVSRSQVRWPTRTTGPDCAFPRPIHLHFFLAFSSLPGQ